MLNRMSILLKKPFQAREKHVLTRKCQSFGGGQLGEGWQWWWWIIMFPGLSKKWGFLPDREGKEEVTISDSLHRWWPPSVNILVKMAVYLFFPSVYTERNKKGKKKKAVEKCLRRQNLRECVRGGEGKRMPFDCHRVFLCLFKVFFQIFHSLAS